MKNDSEINICREMAIIQSRKKHISILLFVILNIVLVNSTRAQNRIEGTYNAKKRTFEAVNKNYTIKDFREGLAPFRINDKFGVIDSNGIIICPMKYDEIEPFMDGVARVEIFGDYPTQFGFIDTKGKEIVPVQYTDADDFFYRSMRFSDLLVVGKNNKYACYDKTGKLVLPMEYSNIGNYRNGLATILKDGKWGYIN